MISTRAIIFFLFLGSLWGWVGCGEEDPVAEEVAEMMGGMTNDDTVSATQSLSLPEVPYTYRESILPAFMTESQLIYGFVEMSMVEEDNLPPEQPITDEGATLGRVLFYDKRLSANGEISCASCHQQRLGFSDPRKNSIGFDGKTTRRHAMSLVNSRYYRNGRFFWDEGAGSLEEQVVMPFLDEIEMGLSEEELIRIISSTSYYSALFQQAFGDTAVTTQRISTSLSQFVRSIVSYRTKYDEGRAKVTSVLEDFPNFNESENLGKQLFFRRFNDGFACFECHTTEGFVGTLRGPQNNGIDSEFGNDLGAFETYSDRPELKGSFKVPTLRNIGVTAPYMHDGRFRTLMDVINHYNEGVKDHPALSEFMKGADGRPFRLQLNEQEKQAMVDFLHTLTDHELNRDIKFSDPFQQ